MVQFDRQLSARVGRLRGHALYCVYLFYFLFSEKKGRGRMEKVFGLFDIGVCNPAKTTIQLREARMSPHSATRGTAKPFHQRREVLFF